MSEKEPEESLKLEQAAEKLLELINEREQFLIEQTCENQRLTKWMYILGILKRALDTGEHTQPSVDPLWMELSDWKEPVLPKATCPICKKSFKPRWRGQLYDNDLCGARAVRMQLDRTAVPAGDPVEFGQEPEELLKSTISGVSLEQIIEDAGRALAEATDKHRTTGTVGQDSQAAE